MPGYNSFREACKINRALKFKDLEGEIPSRIIRKFEKLYPSVDDIDLFPGALSERAVSGGLVGPTFACILGKQFERLRKCDRFWYENSDPFTRFTEAQLSQIRKATLAKLLCDNLDDVQHIQRNALDMPDTFMNPRVPCSSLPGIDLKLWKERTDCEIDGKTVKLGEASRVTPCKMCTCTKEGVSIQE